MTAIRTSSVRRFSLMAICCALLVGCGEEGPTPQNETAAVSTGAMVTNALLSCQK